MNTTVVTPVLFKVNRTLRASSVEHYTGELFEPGQIVWLNYTKKLRTGSTIANVCKTYHEGQRVFKRDGETFSLPNDLITPIESHAYPS